MYEFIIDYSGPECMYYRLFLSGKYEFIIDYSGPECMNVLDRSGRIPLHLAVLACKKNPDKGLQCVK